MWFAENRLKIDIKIKIPIEIFEIILFLYIPEKIFYVTKKNQFMFSDNYVNILILPTITTTAKNKHTHSLTYNYNRLFMYYSPLIFQSIAYKYSATSIGTEWHYRVACKGATFTFILLVEDVLKSYISNEILLVAISI